MSSTTTTNADAHTVTATVTETEAAALAPLPLQLAQPDVAAAEAETTSPRGGIRWAEGTVDNEHLGRKSSKACCTYLVLEKMLHIYTCTRTHIVTTISLSRSRSLYRSHKHTPLAHLEQVERQTDIQCGRP